MKIKLAYIGGGSKQWARVFMNDLALAEGLEGEIALYDIDVEAARRNQAIGNRINNCENCVSKWNYVVYECLEDALEGADFVALSILPGTFDEMAVDVHTPEKYGIYQTVGDTVGPGGVLRAMRTVPIYEGFAKAIAKVCPNAWVINFTNPMSICVKTLYDVFPQIKAFGCCHEVFHAQNFLCAVAAEELGVPRPDRHDIYTDASGVNHFTWITEASYQGHDLLKLLPDFMDKYYESGFYSGTDPEGFKNGNPFTYANRVKMDFYKRFGALGAAGDRHLVEFVNNSWYLQDKKTVNKWMFHLTSVDYRKEMQIERVNESIRLANGEQKVEIHASDEEAIQLMKAILGFGRLVSNVNIVNVGQMQDMPPGCVVETNCVFDIDSVKPVVANPLPQAVKNLVYRNAVNIETCYEGIKKRNLDVIFESFVNQPLCSTVTVEQARKLFIEMLVGTRKYLDEFYDIDAWIKLNS